MLQVVQEYLLRIDAIEFWGTFRYLKLKWICIHDCLVAFFLSNWNTVVLVSQQNLEIS